MSHPDAEKWNAKHHAGGHDRSEPVQVLRDYRHLLPREGEALDLACGTGANALFLARHGLVTSAWDISDQAISVLRTRASENNLILKTRICDVTDTCLPEQGFNVITVSYFLERTLFPAILNALRPGGLLFYQTWLRERITDKGPRNENYRLGTNELLQLCSGLHIILYREEGLIGDPGRGLRDEAMLIGQRR
ncbi:MAG: class I SAM-dependent methyltransferase [Gammaproteobacteria bacterium]